MMILNRLAILPGGLCTRRASALLLQFTPSSARSLLLSSEAIGVLYSIIPESLPQSIGEPSRGDLFELRFNDTPRLGELSYQRARGLREQWHDGCGHQPDF